MILRPGDGEQESNHLYAKASFGNREMVYVVSNGDGFCGHSEYEKYAVWIFRTMNFYYNDLSMIQRRSLKPHRIKINS